MSFFTGAEHHTAMQVPFSAFASGSPTLSLQLINRSFYHGLIGKIGLNKPGDLISEPRKRLSKSGKFMSVST